MAGRTVILREATDIRKLATFAEKELKAWGYAAPTVSKALYIKMQKQGTRFATLTEDGAITAALAVTVGMTMAKEKLCIVSLLLVAYDHPDKVRALDALVLWGCNILRSEGVRTLTSGFNRDRHVGVYGESIGMTVAATAVSAGKVKTVERAGDIETIIRRILERRPAWQLSP